MGTPYSRAPHVGGPASGGTEAPHAALLIDFDNVTMGMRSDLSRELKSLLDSDVIKGKVSVQRAYADWRRYPQYIVPLSEASVDLIFAPAYGSNKKNATDIRMAIDGMELVFVRPEIGTYILLTGDSDFSSLVLKLKEYGKYVIGVGIQESSSDILVQNCDEYYSYTTLTGLKKTTETDQRPTDAWVLVTEALKKMVARNDVMRSDRLKQVMQEIDTNFDEGSIGFSKFSRFLAEASSRGLVKLKKMDNGQYEVSPTKGGRGRRSDSGDRSDRGDRGDRGGRRDRSGRRDRGRGRRDEQPQSRKESETAETADAGGDPLQGAYDMLTKALEQLRDGGRQAVRDSDVKRKLLEMDRSFDEAELGFPKFSKFLKQAEDHDVVGLRRTQQGNYQVSLPGADTSSDRGSTDDEQPEPQEDTSRDEDRQPTPDHAQEEPQQASAEEATEQMELQPDHAASGGSGSSVVKIDPSDIDESVHRLGPRRGTTRRRSDDPPPLFEGQVVTTPGSSSSDNGSSSGATGAGATGAGATGGRSSAERGGESSQDRPDSRSPAGPAASGGSFDAGALGLPTDPPAILRYLAHRYKGVGEKTAETLVDRFGTDLFRIMRDDPSAVIQTVPGRRGEQVLEAWEADYRRRASRLQGSGS